MLTVRALFHNMFRVQLFFVLAGILMTSIAVAAEPTGASLIWTSDEPHIVQARQLILAGKLSEAERFLASYHDEASLEGIDMVARLRDQFDVDEPSLLAELKRSIPNVTSDNLARWRADGSLDYRTFDGKTMYFDRAVGNLFRRSAEARELRGMAAGNGKQFADQEKWSLTDHLAQVVAAAKSATQPAVEPIRHRVKYSITINPLPDWVKAGSVARIWMPYPQEDRQQSQIRLIATSIPPTQIADSGVPHRSVYFEIPIKDPKAPLAVTEEFEFVCSAWYPKLSDEAARPLKPEWGDQYLQERLPHWAFTPAMRSKVAEIIGGETNPLRKARLIFNWIDKNIPWCAEQEYGNLPSLSTKGLTAMTGDCGIQGSLFITMCRVAGVPARWQSGWELKPFTYGMHDWAEFYVEPWGWLPADASYGRKPSNDPDVHNFYLGHQDSYRLIVNTDIGCPLVPPKQSLRSEPADFQRGEVEIDGRNLYFNQWTYNFSVTSEPAK